MHGKPRKSNHVWSNPPLPPSPHPPYPLPLSHQASPISPHSPRANGSLHQVLGVAFGLAVLIGNTIATGILRTPGEVASHLPSTGLFLGVWVLGGLYALLGAASLAEGGVIVRRSGGPYTIVQRALGRYPAFVVGWSDWISTSASTTLGAIVFAEFAAPLLPPVPGGIKAIACVLILAFGWLQWNGVKSGDIAQQLLSGVKALAFAVLIVAALVMSVPAVMAPATPVGLPHGTGLIAAIVLALQAVIFTYDGWTSPTYFGEETVDVGHAMPRTMITGVLLVMAIYLFFNIAMLRVVGLGAMAGDPFVAGSAGAILFGPKGELVIRIIVLIALLSGINSNVLIAARIPLAMSRDALLPARFNTVNAGGTPVVSHALSVGAVLLLIITGTFNTVLALAAFYFVANYAMSFIAIFVLRRKEPDTPRPYRAWGYPYSTGLVLVGSVAFLVGAVLSDRANSLRALVLLALSYPLYWMMLRGRATNDA
ncbi:MAG: amino acid permease [Gemmatimonadales bacterium]